MNDVYFACMDCREMVDAGYRWAHWALERTGVVERLRPVTADAIFSAPAYWNASGEPDSEWVSEEVLPRVRVFLEKHRNHRLTYGESEDICGAGDDVLGWLDHSQLPMVTLRYLIEVLELRSWAEVLDWFKVSGHKPWWWYEPELRDSARVRFQSMVR